MGAPIRVEIEGLRELQAGIRHAARRGVDKELVGLADEVGRGLVPVVQREAPVRSGALRAATRSAPVKSGPRLQIGGAGVRYAAPVIYGHATRGLAGNSAAIGRAVSSGVISARTGKRLAGRTRGRGHVPPNPYPYDALDSRVPAIVDKYEERLRGVLDAITGVD